MISVVVQNHSWFLVFGVLYWDLGLWVMQNEKSKELILFGIIQDKDKSFRLSQSSRPKQDCIKQINICLEQIQGAFTLPSPSAMCPSSLH